LFALKGWSFIWALIDKVSVVWFAAGRSLGGGELWAAPSAMMGAAAAALIVPAGITIAVTMMLTRSTRRVG
jgi:hypothetical protein